MSWFGGAVEMFMLFGGFITWAFVLWLVIYYDRKD